MEGQQHRSNGCLAWLTFPMSLLWDTWRWFQGGMLVHCFPSYRLTSFHKQLSILTSGLLTIKYKVCQMLPVTPPSITNGFTCLALTTPPTKLVTHVQSRTLSHSNIASICMQSRSFYFSMSLATGQSSPSTDHTTSQQPFPPHVCYQASSVPKNNRAKSKK